MIKRKYFFSVFANNIWRKMLYLLYHNHFKPVSYTHLDVYKRQTIFLIINTYPFFYKL